MHCCRWDGAKAIDADPDFKMLNVIVDEPLMHFRRTLDKLIAEEVHELG